MMMNQQPTQPLGFDIEGLIAQFAPLLRYLPIISGLTSGSGLDPAILEQYLPQEPEVDAVFSAAASKGTSRTPQGEPGIGHINVLVLPAHEKDPEPRMTLTLDRKITFKTVEDIRSIANQLSAIAISNELEDAWVQVNTSEEE